MILLAHITCQRMVSGTKQNQMLKKNWWNLSMKFFMIWKSKSSKPGTGREQPQPLANSSSINNHLSRFISWKSYSCSEFCHSNSYPKTSSIQMWVYSCSCSYPSKIWENHSTRKFQWWWRWIFKSSSSRTSCCPTFHSSPGTFAHWSHFYRRLYSWTNESRKKNYWSSSQICSAANYWRESYPSNSWSWSQLRRFSGAGEKK